MCRIFLRFFLDLDDLVKDALENPWKSPEVNAWRAAWMVQPWSLPPMWRNAWGSYGNRKSSCVFFPNSKTSKLLGRTHELMCFLV